MENVFAKYSEYYDLIYTDKNYQKEVDYIDQLIQKYHPKAKTILDLGCGTGVHANLLAAKGYRVMGIDLSTEMIQIANSKKESVFLKNADNLNFQVGDVREVRLDDQFDVVVSLFHVFSYLNSNDDLIAGYDTVQYHLKEGGVCFFDFWYGPGVLSDPPTVRVKRLENQNLKVLRIANPILHINENIVVVNFELIIKDKKENTEYNLEEKHSMRYFFKPEIDLLVSKSKPKEYYFLKWLDYDLPSKTSWYAFAMCKK